MYTCLRGILPCHQARKVIYICVLGNLILPPSQKGEMYMCLRGILPRHQARKVRCICVLGESYPATKPERWDVYVSLGNLTPPPSPKGEMYLIPPPSQKGEMYTCLRGILPRHQARKVRCIRVLGESYPATKPERWYICLRGILSPPPSHEMYRVLGESYPATKPERWDVYVS